MKAALVFHLKYRLDDGGLVEMVVWRVPVAVAGSRHDYKYGLYFGKDGRRLVSYDNERGKGDHRHVRGREYAYRFISPEQLIADFLTDIEKARSEK